MPTNRKRNKTITIRVTEQERRDIMEQVHHARSNLTDYLITAALNTEIHVPEDTRPILTELKRIGNNLNQITQRINAGVFKSYNFAILIKEMKAVCQELARIGGQDTWRP